MEKILEKLYLRSIELIDELGVIFRFFVERCVRFLALPYFYCYQINWEECKKNKFLVAYDLLYIFFSHKRFPDNYCLCRLWDKDREIWKYYYGSNYDSHQKRKLEKFVQKNDYKVVFDNKEICHSLCLGRGLPVPLSFGCIDSLDNYVEKVNRIFNVHAGDLIAKPVLGSGGKGIFLLIRKDGKIIVKTSSRILPLLDFNWTSRYIIQERLVAHEDLLPLSSALPTIRIVTLLKNNGAVHIVGALIRFGLGEAIVDNTSSGGISSGVDLHTGKLKEYAFDNRSRVYRFHPGNGKEFKHIQVPHWDLVLNLAKTVQLEFPFYRLLGLDIAVARTGIYLIEINPSYDNNGLEQKNGPILLDRGNLQEYADNRLLYNRHQMDILSIDGYKNEASANS